MRVLYFLLRDMMIIATLVIVQGIAALAIVQKGSDIEAAVTLVCATATSILLIVAISGLEFASVPATVKKRKPKQAVLMPDFGSSWVSGVTHGMSSADIFEYLNRRLTAHLVREVIRRGG